eukprot:12582710-Alexandrium_andersonii.AAC.1
MQGDPSAFECQPKAKPLERQKAMHWFDEAHGIAKKVVQGQELTASIADAVVTASGFLQFVFGDGSSWISE